MSSIKKILLRAAPHPPPGGVDPPQGGGRHPPIRGVYDFYTPLSRGGCIFSIHPQWVAPTWGVTPSRAGRPLGGCSIFERPPNGCLRTPHRRGVLYTKTLCGGMKIYSEYFPPGGLAWLFCLAVLSYSPPPRGEWVVVSLYSAFEVGPYGPFSHRPDTK